MEIVAAWGTENYIHAKYHELNSPHGLWESWLLKLPSEKSVYFSTRPGQWMCSSARGRNYSSCSLSCALQWGMEIAVLTAGGKGVSWEVFKQSAISFYACSPNPGLLKGGSRGCCPAWIARESLLHLLGLQREGAYSVLCCKWVLCMLKEEKLTGYLIRLRNAPLRQQMHVLEFTGLRGSTTWM